MKKNFLIILLFFLVIGGFTYKLILRDTQQSEFKEVQQSTQEKLVQNFKSSLVENLFSQVEDHPTQESLQLLFWGIQTRQTQIESIIEINKPNINTGTWTGYKQLHVNKLKTYILRLSAKESISLKDREKLTILSEKWSTMESYLAIDVNGNQVVNATSFTYNYVTTMKEINNLLSSIES